MDVLLFLAGLT